MRPEEAVPKAFPETATGPIVERKGAMRAVQHDKGVTQ
jgi:hypothetical protein